MTREEAISILKESNINNITVRTGYEKVFDQREEAFSLAIKVLEQEPTYYPPCIDCHKKMDEIRRTYDKLKEQQPMLDKIRAKIEALPKTYPFYNHIDTYVKEDDVRKIIDKYRVESEEV